MSKIASDKTKIKQRIESLERQSQIIRRELEDELETTKEKVTNYGKIALGIGGGLIFSAIILKGLVGSKSGKSDLLKKHGSTRVYQRFIDQLINEVSNQATMFLLGIVKDKLNSYTAIKENTEDDDSEITG